MSDEQAYSPAHVVQYQALSLASGGTPVMVHPVRGQRCIVLRPDPANTQNITVAPLVNDLTAGAGFVLAPADLPLTLWTDVPLFVASSAADGVLHVLQLGA